MAETKCQTCDGSGRCEWCGGRGQDCAHCRGMRTCYHCAGSGRLLVPDDVPDEPPAPPRMAKPVRPPTPLPDVRVVGPAAAVLHFDGWRFNGKVLRGQLTYRGGAGSPPAVERTDVEVRCFRDGNVLLDTVMLDMPYDLRRGQTCEVKLELDVLLDRNLKRLQRVEISLLTESD